MPASNGNAKDKAKNAPAPKKAVKDLPVRKADADRVKGGIGNAGEERLR